MGSNRLDIVGEMGPIGCSHLPEQGSAPLHHIGNAEGPPDFDQFSPRDDHLSPLREGVEDEKNRPGVVVDHHG